MSEREPTDYSRMAKWPAEAKELPEGPRRRYRSRWVGLGAGLGLGALLVFFGVMGGGDVAYLLGRATAWGVGGFLVGYAMDRRAERLDRIHGR